MGNQWSQLFPPPPTFTGTSIPSLHDRTIMITGASSGTGSALASLLYSQDAKIYIATRSETKALGAIANIKAQFS